MDIPFARPMLSAKEKIVASKVLKGHVLTHGPKCRSFEENFQNYHSKTSHAVTLSNCTAALFLALKSLNIGRGDEVIVPAMTHIATAHSVMHTGAKVVFVDIDKDTGNIDVNKIMNKVTNKTKASIIVHFIGLPCDMKKILDIVQEKKIFLIEDCAAALGAKYGNKAVGTFGYAGCFSFYPTKHITTMEGGMIITRDNKTSKMIRKLSAFGYTKNFQERTIPGVYDIDALGYNFRMSEVAAALGIVQLSRLKSFILKRTKNSLTIRKELKNCKNIFILPMQSKKSVSSNFCVNIILKKGDLKKRNGLILKLKKNNIGTSVHYPVSLPNSIFYSKSKRYKKEEFPVANFFAENSISLPCGPHLNTTHLKYMCKILKECLEDI